MQTDIIHIMGFLKISTTIFLIAASVFWSFSVVAGRDVEGITENECARRQDAEIVWDLSKFRWMCCIIKNEDEYENCIPITDMEPLPKTSLKPFPPNTTRTIRPKNQKK